MSLGRKILNRRMELNLTQRGVSELTGLAIAYLSRLENNRVTPSVRTLSRISEGLEVPLSYFFEGEPVLEAGDRCPVTLSGLCVLDHAYAHHGKRPKSEVGSYSPEQLEILRLCNFLLQSGDKKVLTTLSTLMRSLIQSTGSSKQS